MLGAQFRITRLLLHADKLDGLHRQSGEIFTKRFGNDFLRLVQMHAGVHQIDRCLNGFRATNLLENRGHSVGVGQRVLTGFHDFASNQRLGKSAGTR